MNIIKEFKTFAIKGNVIDLAVGVIIGAAFGKIITSLVSDVLMPPLGLAIGGVDFTQLKFVMKDAIINSTGIVLKPAVTINYGNFIQSLVDFIIIAFAIFLMIKLLNNLKKKEEEKTNEPAIPTNTENLLSEIRDILKFKG